MRRGYPLSRSLQGTVKAMLHYYQAGSNLARIILHVRQCNGRVQQRYPIFEQAGGYCGIRVSNRPDVRPGLALAADDPVGAAWPLDPAYYLSGTSLISSLILPGMPPKTKRGPKEPRLPMFLWSEREDLNLRPLHPQ